MDAVNQDERSASRAEHLRALWPLCYRLGAPLHACPSWLTCLLPAMVLQLVSYPCSQNRSLDVSDSAAYSHGRR